MSETLHIARLFGIDIKLHFPWILIFLLITGALEKITLPSFYPGWAVTTYWAIGVSGSVLLFPCVLVH